MTRLVDAQGTDIPLLVPGTELLGEFEGAGLSDPVFLARRPDGTMAQLSLLLHLVLSSIDGRRDLEEIANQVTLAYGRRLDGSDVAYVVENKLRPLGLIQGLSAEGGQPEGAPRPLTGLTVRGAVLPPGPVGAIARLLAPLFATPVVAVFLAAFLAADIWIFSSEELAFDDLIRESLFSTGSLLTLYGLMILSMFLHELGHASAISYGGGKPGPIGAGLYLLWPAFYTDVTDSYRLPRAARIRTDLGGLYFNVVFTVAVAAAFALTGSRLLILLVVLQHILMAVQLLPLLRLDGYYLLTDLLGVPDLFARVRPVLASMIPGRPLHPRAAELHRWARVTLTVWSLAMLAASVAGLVLFGLRFRSWFGMITESIRFHWALVPAAWEGGDIGLAVVGLLQLLLVALPLVALSALVWKLTIVLGRRIAHRGTSVVQLEMAGLEVKGLSTAPRGFDRRQVQAVVKALGEKIEQKENAIQDLRQELEEERGRASQACSDLGDQVGDVFARAVRQARIIREGAESDAAAVRQAAQHERTMALEAVQAERDALRREHHERMALLEARGRELAGTNLLLRKRLEMAAREIANMIESIGSMTGSYTERSQESSGEDEATSAKVVSNSGGPEVAEQCSSSSGLIGQPVLGLALSMRSSRSLAKSETEVGG